MFQRQRKRKKQIKNSLVTKFLSEKIGDRRRMTEPMKTIALVQKKCD